MASASGASIPARGLARRKQLLLAMQEDAAIVIQSFFRGRVRMVATSSLALGCSTIFAMVARYAKRCRYLIAREAVTVVQSFVRCSIARSNACVCLQLPQRVAQRLDIVWFYLNS